MPVMAHPLWIIYPSTEVQVAAVLVKVTTGQCGHYMSDLYKGYNQIFYGSWTSILERLKVRKDHAVHFGPRISQIDGDIPVYTVDKPDWFRT